MHLDTLSELQQQVHLASSRGDAHELRIIADKLRAIGSDDSAGMAHQCDAIICRYHGDFNASHLHLDKALECFARSDNMRGRGSALVSKGNLYAAAAQLEEALQCFREAIDLLQHAGSSSALATIYGNIGLIHEESGNYVSALEHLYRGLSIAEDEEDQPVIARILGGIGSVYIAVAEYPRAAEYLHRALVAHEDVGSIIGQASTHSNIGTVQFMVKEYDAALRSLTRALELFEQIGNVQGATHARYCIGTNLESIGRAQEALVWLDQAVTDAQRIGSIHDLTSSLVSRSRALLAINELDRALADASQALELSQRHSLVQQEATSHASLALIAIANDDPLEATTQYEKARALASSHGLTAELAAYERALSDLVADADPSRALEMLKRAFEHSETILGEQQRRHFMITDTENRLEDERHQREREYISRQKERALLYSMLPDSVAERLLAGERIIADEVESASVLFLDLVNFTRLAAHITPRELIMFLDGVFATCDEIAEQHGLTKIKTIGDAWMAVAGVPRLREDHVPVIATAALALRSAFVDQRILGHPVAVRIGVHCGPLIAGTVGRSRAAFDVWGDTVNIAARLEQNSQPNRVLVSAAVADELNRSAPDRFTLIERGDIDLKGKGRLSTWWLEG